MTRPSSEQDPRVVADTVDGSGPAADPAHAGAVDPHRPVVDGRSDERSPQDKRADVEELRAELGDTVAELAHRVDVPARMRERRDEATAQARAGLDRGQSLLDEKAPPVGRAVREQPALVAAAVALIVVLLAGRRRRNRSKGLSR